MSQTRKVSIYTEGVGNDVKIMNEDGEVLTGIYSAQINIEAGSIVTVELIIKAPSVGAQNVVVNEVVLVCPLCSANQEHICS